MNKISKKIVALVTMAAFVLTLVPFAAFAAGEVSADKSSYTATASAVNKIKVAATFNDTDANGVTGYTKAQVVVKDVKTNKSLSSNSAVTVAGTALSGDTNTNVATLETEIAPGTANATYTYSNVPAGTYNVDVYVQNAAGAAYVKVGETQKVTVAGTADRSKSVYGAVDAQGDYQATATVATYETLTTGFEITDINGYETSANLPNVFVWAIDEDTNAPTSYFSVNGTAAANASGVKVGTVNNTTTLDVTFTQPGTYTLYAGIGTSYTAAKDLLLKGATVVTVTDSTAVDSMELTAGWKVDGSASTTAITGDAFKFDKDAKTYTLDLTQVTGFKFNGISEVVLNGKAFNEDGSPALRQTINFTVNEPNTVVELDKTSDNTASTGTFDVAFTMQSQKNAVITVTDEATGESYDVLVVAQKTTATNIDRTKTGGYVLATTDDQWTADVNAKLGGAVEFMVTDEKGNAVEGLADSAFKIDVRSQAAKSSLTASDLEVVEVGDGLYTLSVKADEVAADKNILTAGKYEVRVALAGADSENDNATVTFNAAEFGKIKDVELNIVDSTSKVALDDKITLDTTADVSLVYVDANGVKVAGPDTFDWNATNSALAIKSTAGYQIVMKADTIEHQGVVGSVVKVQASVPGYGLVEKELTIVSSYNTYSMEFDPAEGPVNEYNKVDLTVLNNDGDVAKNIKGDVNVVVVDSSNDDAKVSVKANGQVSKGEGALTVYASQETELEVVITVVDEDGKIVAADTLNYTVGAADPLAGRSVVMTIGSTEYVVNNQIITGDAAPFVDSNWRTMVPIRALAESFDAEVNWDNDARTVTINYDADTQIVMTIGEDTYTVNGADQTMDTEPVIQGDRTYVPIRFAAEALGFTVTPLYNSNGLTGSVVFQR